MKLESFEGNVSFQCHCYIFISCVHEWKQNMEQQADKQAYNKLSQSELRLLGQFVITLSKIINIYSTHTTPGLLFTK